MLRESSVIYLCQEKVSLLCKFYVASNLLVWLDGCGAKSFQQIEIMGRPRRYRPIYGAAVNMAALSQLAATITITIKK